MTSPELDKAEPGNPLSFFMNNVDQWGAADWFDRLVKAVKEHDKAVVADDINAQTFRMIISSSALTLARDFEATVRDALTENARLETELAASRERERALERKLDTCEKMHLPEATSAAVMGHMNCMKAFETVQERCLAAEAEVKQIRADTIEECAKIAETRYAKTTAANFDPDPPTRAYVDLLKAELAELRQKLEEARRDNEELDFLLNEGGTWEQQLHAAEARATAAEQKLEVAERALREAEGHAADFAAAGMLIGDNQNETYGRIAAKGRALLKIIRRALADANTQGGGE